MCAERGLFCKSTNLRANFAFSFHSHEHSPARGAAGGFASSGRRAGSHRFCFIKQNRIPDDFSHNQARPATHATHATTSRSQHHSRSVLPGLCGKTRHHVCACPFQEHGHANHLRRVCGRAGRDPPVQPLHGHVPGFSHALFHCCLGLLERQRFAWPPACFYLVWFGFDCF